MDREKLLFKMNEMEYRKYNRNTEEQNIKRIEVPQKTNVRLSSMNFKENIVSRIDVFKHQGEGSDKDIIFVEIFMGNVEIAYELFYSDVVIDIEYDEDVYGNKFIKSFAIRKVRDYDYRKQKRDS